MKTLKFGCMRLIACVSVLAVSSQVAIAQVPAASVPATHTVSESLTVAPIAASSVAAPAEAAAAATVKTDNPYGIQALWMQSDMISKAVLIILALLSISSWYVIISKAIEQARIKRQAGKAEKAFWSADGVSNGIAALEEGSPFRYVAQTAFEASQKHESVKARVAFSEWIEVSLMHAVERIQRRLSGGMNLLATVGSVSPFIGLFGTVWGIYHALTAIGLAGQASIDKVAGPVGEALIMTAIGLAVAVPAVLGYNFLLRRNVSVMDEVRDFSSELNTALLAGSGQV